MTEGGRWRTGLTNQGCFNFERSSLGIMPTKKVHICSADWGKSMKCNEALLLIKF